MQLIGLGDAASIAAVTVNWPASRKSQAFHGLKPDSFVEITEGTDAVRLLAQPRLPVPALPESSVPAERTRLELGGR